MKLPYKEGDWFAIPLEGGGYATGIVARASKKGKVLLGYFFGPRRYTIPRLEEVSPLKSSQAVRILMFGDLALIQGEWPILGSSLHWDREEWPLPAFQRTDLLTRKTFRVQYAEDDPIQVISDELMKEPDPNLGNDSMFGAGAVEIELSEILEADKEGKS